MKKKNKLYNKKAQELKKQKLIDYDLRKPLNPQQKAAITRKWRKHSHYFDDKKYVRRSVSPKRAREFKKLGYEVIENRVFIPTEGYDPKRIKIKHNYVKYTGSDKALKVFIIPKADIVKELEKRAAKQLPPGVFITVRIGSNSAFRKAFDTGIDLLKYVNNWQPRDSRTDRENLIDEMSLVEYYR